MTVVCQHAQFKKLRVARIATVCGFDYDLSGQILSDTIWESITDLNPSHVDLVALLQARVERIRRVRSAAPV